MKFIRAAILLAVLSVILPFVGALMNIVAMDANEGKMPVAMPSSNITVWDSRHEPLTPDTNYVILCDIFHIGPGIYSLGDFLILSPDFLFDWIYFLTILGVGGMFLERVIKNET